MLVGVALQDRVEQVEVAETDVLDISSGIIGFEDYRRYALFRLDLPLFLLQSVENAYVGFVMMDPTLLDPKYRPVLTTEESNLLGLGSEEQPVYLAIVTLGGDGGQTTANLRAPVAFNPGKRLAAQIVLQDTRQSVRVPVPVSDDGTVRVSMNNGSGGRRVSGEKARSGQTGKKRC